MSDNSIADAPIQEGEVITTAAVQSTLDLSGLINNYLQQITALKTQLGKFKEMLEDIYTNDPTYQQHDAAVKEATKVRSLTKKQIQKQPAVADLVGKIQELKNQIREHSRDLSGHLQDYARTTGSQSFETYDGQVREIVYTAKLVSKSAPSRFS